MAGPTISRRDGALTELKAGDNLASVRLNELLSAEGRVEVWRGSWPDGAAATVHALASDATRLERDLFQRAARKLTVMGMRKRLHGVVTVAAAVPSAPAYVTRTAASGTLADVPLLQWELEACVSCLRRLGRALFGLHRAGLVHGSLMPFNVLLDQQRDPVMADVGTVAVAQSYGRNSTFAHAYLPFAAPEVRRGRKPTTRADIFSFGRLLWFCTRGEQPEDEDGDVPRLAMLDDLPDGLVRIIRRCTVLHAEDRYATLEEVLTDLSLYTQVDEVGLGLPASAATHGRAAGVAHALSEPPEAYARRDPPSSFPPVSGPAPGRSWSDPELSPLSRASPLPDRLSPLSGAAARDSEPPEDDPGRTTQPAGGLGSAILDDAVVDAAELGIDRLVPYREPIHGNDPAQDLSLLDEQLRLAGRSGDPIDDSGPISRRDLRQALDDAAGAVAERPHPSAEEVFEEQPLALTRPSRPELYPESVSSGPISLSEPISVRPPPPRAALATRRPRPSLRPGASAEPQDVVSPRVRWAIAAFGLLALLAAAAVAYVRATASSITLALAVAGAMGLSVLLPRLGPPLVWRLASALLLGMAMWMLNPAVQLADWSRCRSFTRCTPHERGLRIQHSRDGGEMSFEQLDLRGTDFSGMDLSHARFDGSDLRSAIFRGSVLRAVSFKDTRVTGADFSGAELSGVDPTTINGWRSSSCDAQTVLPEPWSCVEGLPIVEQ